MQENMMQKCASIFERIASYYGFVPRIYQELQRSPEAFKAFFYKNEQLATDSALPGLTKELIAIGAAAALGSEYCLDTHVKGAKRLGARDDQIFLAILLEPASQRLRRYPNHFVRGSVKRCPAWRCLRDRDHINRLFSYSL